MRGNRGSGKATLVRRFLLASLLASALALVLTASPGVAAARADGTLRVDETSDFDHVDPALAFFAQSWRMLNVTCLRVVGYPDADPPLGSTLIPEAAEALPSISADGRTYTFTIRDGFAFSPPSNEIVTAQTFKFTIERALYPQLQSPAAAYMSDIVGAQAYIAGTAPSISGIVASGRTLSITLVEPRGDFLARLALPFFCAVPTTTPFTEQFTPVPSAGPYYLAQWIPRQSAVALPNPNYPGPRARNFDRIEWYVIPSCATQVLRVQADMTDLACVTAEERPRLRAAYGPGSPVAQAGRQQYFVQPQLLTWYLALNTERQAFADETLRRAVAYALDRRALAALLGFDAAIATDQILPRGIAGFRDVTVFPLGGNLRRAKALATEAGVTPHNRINVVMYSFDRSFGPTVAEYVKDALAPLGIDVTVQLFDRATQNAKMATRGEPFDIGLEGWFADYNDPFNVLDTLLNGARIQATGNDNVSYFDDPAFNARLDAAAALTGAERYATYAALDHDLTAVAPIVPFANTTAVYFFSERIGCQQFPPLYGIALNALCVRPR